MKKETIRIFFACSTNSFSNEKEEFKKFFETLNKKYKNSRQDLTAKYECCDSLESDDSLFKKIFRHYADIIVYLIDENIEENEDLRKKLIDNIEKNIQNRKRKVLLYIPKDIKKTLNSEDKNNEPESVTERIRGLLEKNSLKYAPFQDIDNLKESIENNIFLVQRKIKKVDIYISCSTKNEVLTNQKTKITKLCGDLNVEYAKKRENVNIKVVGYDDHERRSEIFEKFTTHTADIVVFLVDKDIDNNQKKVLKNELQLACSRYKKYRKPEILVYMKDDVNESLKEVVHDRLIINGLSSSTIEDLNALESDVKENIEKYINSYNVLKKIHNIEKIKEYSVIIAILFLIVSGVFSTLYIMGKQKRLLFAGGGSVMAYILKECNTDLFRAKPLFWLYAPMPSSHTGTLLTEETIKDEKNRRYYPICLSAAEIKDSVFLGNISPTIFKRTGIVVSVFLGYDALTAYCKSSYFDSIFLQDTIKSSELQERIRKDTNIKIYTTSDGSGTRDAYNKEVGLNLSSKDTIHVNRTICKINFFKDIDNIDTSWGNYIILGSKYYLPNDPNSNGRMFTVRDTNDSVILKPIYIYFMAYRKKDGTYAIPNETINFFKKIGRDLPERKYVVRRKLFNPFKKEYIIPDTSSYIFKVNPPKK